MLDRIKENLYVLKKSILKMIKCIKAIIFNTSDFIVQLNLKNNFKYSYLIPDELYLKCWYKNKTGEKLNLKKPVKLNEKLQWLKLHDKNPLYKVIVDKNDVKDYIKTKIGEEHVIRTLGVWNSFDEIDFSKLPAQFVLKCTHDSGSVVICKDKQTFDINHAKTKIEFSLNRDYFWKYREWPYKELNRRIICEEYLEQSNSEPLVDYKFYCFNGVPKYFMYSIGEAEHAVRNHKFDMNCESIDHFFKKTPTVNPNEISFPENFGEMVRIVEVLCQGFPHIRVDLYNVSGRILVGELTLYSNAGALRIESQEYSQQLADCIDIDKI